MKKFIKLTALFLCLTMALLAFAACGSKDKKEIEALVGTFFENALTLNMSGALACIDENTDYYEDCLENGPMGLDPDSFSISELLGDEASQMLGDSAQDFIDGIIDMTRRHSNYTVESIDIKSDEASVKISLTLPNFNDIDTEQLAAGIVDSADLQLDPDEFLAYIEEQDFDLNSASQDEIVAMVYGYLQNSGILDTIVDSILASMDENMSTETIESSFQLKRINGRWLIVGEN